MSTSPIAAAPAATPSRVPARNALRWFHSAAVAILFVLVFLGFQQFYLHGRAFPDRPLAPPIRGLLIAHGISMTLWMLLMLVQPLLIANRKPRLHMKLGMIGAVLAVAVFLLGVRVAIAAAKVAPPEFVLWDLDAKQFMAASLGAVFLFVGFITVGIVKRNSSDVHRPMMLLGTLAIVAAALDRIPWLRVIHDGTFLAPLFGPFFSAVVIGGVFLAIKCALSRSFDKAFAIGWGVLILGAVCSMTLAKTALWDSVASFLMGG